MVTRRYSKERDEFSRKFTMPFEEWLTSGRRWLGGYRWFLTPNVIPIEHWRRVVEVEPEYRKAG